MLCIKISWCNYNIEISVIEHTSCCWCSCLWVPTEIFICLWSVWRGALFRSRCMIFLFFPEKELRKSYVSAAFCKCCLLSSTLLTWLCSYPAADSFAAFLVQSLKEFEWIQILSHLSLYKICKILVLVLVQLENMLNDGYLPW